MFKGFIRGLLIIGCTTLFSFKAVPLHQISIKNQETTSGIIASNNTTVSQMTAKEKHQRVGIVVSVKGKNFVHRADGTKLPAAPRTNILKGDELVTSAEGYLQVTFKDGSILKLVGKGSMFVNDFLYDEEKGMAGGELTTEGSTFIFMSGKISKIAPQNFKVKTATATIGIRGSTIDATIGPKGEMKITGGGIFAMPVGGGETLDFPHDGPQVAYALGEGGKPKKIAVPKEGGFFKQKAKNLFPDDLDEVMGTEEDEEEDEEETGDAMGEEEKAEEAFEEGELSFDFSDLYSSINEFDLDLDSLVEESSNHYIKNGQLYSSSVVDNLLYFGDESEPMGIEDLNYVALNEQGTLQDASFIAFSRPGEYDLGYTGQKIAAEALPSSGILNFTSAMTLSQPNGNDDFPLSVLNPEGNNTYLGDNDVFLDLNKGQLFGSFTLDSQASNQAGVYGLEDTQNSAVTPLYSHLDINLPLRPNIVFYSSHNSFNLSEASFEAQSLQVAANLGYGVVNGEFLGSAQHDLLSLDDFVGAAQVYGGESVEGIGIYAENTQGDGGLVAASFSEGSVISTNMPANSTEYVGLARGIELNFNDNAILQNQQLVASEQLSFSVDLNQKTFEENSLLFELNNNKSLQSVSQSSFVLSQELVFSALQGTNTDASQSFLMANPVPIVKDSSQQPVKVEGVLWGTYNLVDENAQEIHPGQMNFFVAGEATDDSYFLSGANVKQERKDTPIAIYKGAAYRTVVDPIYFNQSYQNISSEDQLPFFTGEGYSSVLVNYEDETFQHYSVFPDGYLLVGTGNLENVDLNGAAAGGTQFGLNSEEWRVIHLGPHFHSELFAKGDLTSASTDFPNSEFIGGFASDEAESLFFSFQREHTAAGSIDQAVYGVGAAAKVEEKVVNENPVITTGYVHGVLVSKATGNIIADIAEAGKDFDLSKKWKNDTDPGNINDLDVVLHAIDALQPVYNQVSATNTVTASSEQRGVINLYSDYDSGNADSTLERYSADINNTNAKLKDISFSYTFNAKNVLDKISAANGGSTTNATSNDLPLRVFLYARDNAGKFYLLATEAKTYTNVSDFDEWITEDFDFTTGNVQAIRLNSEADLEDHASAISHFEWLESNQGLSAAPLSTWLSHGSADPIANDAEVFKVVVKWGEAAHTNEDTDTDTMALSLDKFTIKDANDDIIFEDNFEAVPVAESLFIDKDAFYLPMDATSQSVFTPDISGYTKVDGKTVISALPGLEEYEYLVWGIWSSEMTEDANPSNHVEAFGMFGGGMLEELSSPDGYASFAAANTVVNYTGKAMGSIFDLSTSQGQFRTGTSVVNVNFNTGNITGGKVVLGDATIELDPTTLNSLVKGLPFNGNAKLGINGATPSGTGSYQGQFFGNNANYALETSGSFSTTNATHKAVGAFGAKRD